MARGITQADVDDAANAIFAAGDRPTVERVRLHMGRGSPNTITGLLDTWWNELAASHGERIERLAIPDAPTPVVDAASALWEAAHRAAQDAAEKDYKERSESLLAMQATLDGRALDLANQEEARQQELSTAHQSIARQDVLIAELRHQVEQLTQQATVLTRQLDESHGERARLQQALNEAKGSHQAAMDGLREAHTRSENHWMTEVDRERQSAKDLQAENKALKRDLADERLSRRAVEADNSKLLEADIQTRSEMIVLRQQINDLLKALPKGAASKSPRTKKVAQKPTRQRKSAAAK